MFCARVSLVLGLSTALFGCDDKPAKAPASGDRSALGAAAASAPKGSSAPSALAPEAPQEVPKPVRHTDGRVLPLEFPNGPLAGKPGDFVLSPTARAVQEAFTLGSDQQTFVYYGGKLEAVGPEASRVALSPGHSVVVPNALVVVVGGKSEARPGDIVLTAWASGTGLQRAIVVDGGAATAPRVRYLDLAPDHPSGFGEKPDTLPEGSFRVLKEPGAVGTTVACEEGQRTTRWIVTAKSEGRLLGLGFAGRLRALDAKTCKSVPLAPKLDVGGTVSVPLLGRYVPAKVESVDTKLGRVVVRPTLPGEDGPKVATFANVLP